jgi:hypothetical protein
VNGRARWLPERESLSQVEQTRDLLQPARNLTRNLISGAQYLLEGTESLLALVDIGRQELGYRSEGRVFIEQQHQKLFTRHGLELLHRHACHALWTQPNAAKRFDGALVNAPAPAQAGIDEAADDGLAQPSGCDPRFQIGDASVQHFSMQRRLARAPERPGAGRVDAHSGLQERRAIDGEESPFGTLIAKIAPAIKGCHHLA